MVEKADGPVSTVLELGSGGGNNASHLKRHFTLTLVDRSPEMLELSRGLNPELEHVEGDMRTMRLDRTFDAVFVHDALAYILTERGPAGRLRDGARTLPAGRERRLRPRLRPGDIRPAHEPRRPRLRRTASAGCGTSSGSEPDPSDPTRPRRRLRVPDPRGRAASASSRTATSAGSSRRETWLRGLAARVRGRRRRAGVRRRAGGPGRLRLPAPPLAAERVEPRQPFAPYRGKSILNALDEV